MVDFRNGRNNQQKPQQKHQHRNQQRFRTRVAVAFFYPSVMMNWTPRWQQTINP